MTWMSAADAAPALSAMVAPQVTRNRTSGFIRALLQDRLSIRTGEGEENHEIPVRRCELAAPGRIGACRPGRRDQAVRLGRAERGLSRTDPGFREGNWPQGRARLVEHDRHPQAHCGG